MEKVTVLKMTLYLDKDGFGVRKETFHCIEKPLTYYNEKGFSGDKVIKKEGIMFLFRDDLPPKHNKYYRHTYCLEHQRDDAVKLMADSIKVEFMEVKSQIDEVYEKIKDKL